MNTVARVLFSSGLKKFGIIKKMTDQEKKKYTKSTILTGNSKRIEEVLRCYWSLKSAENLKNAEPKRDIMDEAKEIFC